MKPGDLSLHLEAYLALKKALGFPLGARERLLRDFVAFAESNGVGVRGTISAQVAFDWACAVSDRCGISGKVARLSVARQFLFHLSAVVPDIEVPSATFAGTTATAEAVSFLPRGDKPSAKSRTVIETARIAAAAHAFNVVGVTG
jgi:hypothetical protein